MNVVRTKPILLALASVALVAGCSSDSSGGDGNLSVVLQAEDTITEELASGDCDECILDGYSVSFSRYVVSVGFVAMSQVDGANAQDSTDVGVADFASLPSTLPELTSFNGIPTGQYTSFGYETPAPGSGVININSVDEGDIDAMVQNGWTYIIEGTLTEDGGDSIDFLIEADAPAVYTDCGLEDEEPGVPVTSNSDVTLTIHGDHIFFNGFPEDEGNVQRLAQWMWTVGEEQDTDGVITREDFEAATNIEELFPVPPSGDYELTGGPVSPIQNAWDFVRAQLGTQGHIFGEGECEWGTF